jgi:aryl-alcohol dehydrogenase-like predicted oxidoreductase
MFPRFQGEMFAHNLKLVERVEEIAREKGVTAAQLALAWVLHQAKDVVALFGTSRRDNLEANLRAVDVQLSEDDLRRLDEVVPKGAAAGTRYPEPGMQTVNR